jgi:hypothetical protein
MARVASTTTQNQQNGGVIEVRHENGKIWSYLRGTWLVGIVVLSASARARTSRVIHGRFLRCEVFLLKNDAILRNAAQSRSD